MLRQVAGDDADGAETDTRAVKFDAGGPRRLVEIGADTGKGDCARRSRHGHVIEGLLDASGAVIHGMIVGEREQIEARVRQRLHPMRMASKVKRACRLVAVGPDVVAVGDDCLQIDEGEVAVHLARHARDGVGEAHHLASLQHHAGRIDLRLVRVEAGVADQNDGEAVGALRRLGIDRRGSFDGSARPGLGCGMERAAA